jgi:hypothetical protein
LRKVISVIILLLALPAVSIVGQTDFRFGFKGGYSMSTQYGITPKDLEYTVDSFFRDAFAGGVMLDFGITESFGIQQEFLYVQKGSRQNIGIPEEDVTTHVEYDLNYFEIPIVFHYTFIHFGNFKIYGAVGYVMSIMLNGEVRLDGIAEVDGSDAYFTYTTNMEGVDIFDYSFLYGAGVEFPLFGINSFFEYRFTIGWNTLEMPTFPDEPPAPLRNQSYNFTLGVYF